MSRGVACDALVIEANIVPLLGIREAPGGATASPSKFFARSLIPFRPNKLAVDQRGAEGPDALQVLIKAPMGLP